MILFQGAFFSYNTKKYTHTKKKAKQWKFKTLFKNEKNCVHKNMLNINLSAIFQFDLIDLLMEKLQ